jgi:transposase
MENGQRKQRRLLSPEEKWEIFLEVISPELSQADAARKWNVDVSTVVRIRQLARDAALRRSRLRSRGGCPGPSRSSWRPRFRRTIVSARR